jgi:fatty-acyl-CoA synthase
MSEIAPSVFRQELTPLHFIERAGEAYADRVAVVDGSVQYTWREFRDRARRFASALTQAGIGKDDRIAFVALNSEPTLLAHFGVPLAGAILVAINTRWSADEVAYVLAHSGAKIVFYSPELEPQLARVPANVRCIDTGAGFEAFLAAGSANPIPITAHEDDSIAINYTSGTTGKPKGVVYHHRGAYLNAIAMALDIQMDKSSRYLWTLPMFHCNGWTFTWAVAAVGATSICIPRVDSTQVWRLFEGGVTHFCAAPTVLIGLVNDPRACVLVNSVRVFTAGAPPSPTLIARMTELNFALDHVYGLTETYGPCTINIPTTAQAALESGEHARMRARQGYMNACAGEVRVVDEQMNDVARDGTAMGEVVMRGNVVMKGYFNDVAATERAFAGGWFHSGDLAVWHADGAIELRDRAKDIIISGGENISTIEVEQAVATHPAVMECAVIAIPDERWGEVPKAFVVLKPGASATEAEIIEHVRTVIARFKAPRVIEFGPLPKTSTGKIQKFVLREKEWKGKEKRIN